MFSARCCQIIIWDGSAKPLQESWFSGKKHKFVEERGVVLRHNVTRLVWFGTNFFHWNHNLLEKESHQNTSLKQGGRCVLQNDDLSNWKHLRDLGV